MESPWHPAHRKHPTGLLNIRLAVLGTAEEMERDQTLFVEMLAFDEDE